MTETGIWNIGGLVVGVVLGLLSIFAVVTSQTSASEPQSHSSVIAYDEAS